MTGARLFTQSLSGTMLQRTLSFMLLFCSPSENNGSIEVPSKNAFTLSLLEVGHVHGSLDDGKVCLFSWKAKCSDDRSHFPILRSKRELIPESFPLNFLRGVLHTRHRFCLHVVLAPALDASPRDLSSSAAVFPE